MGDDTVSQYNTYRIKADDYHRKGQWQEKSQTLHDALSLCNLPGFPEAERRRQEVLFEMAGVKKRMGQYHQAIESLKEALNSFEHTSPIMRSRILGEQGVLYRHLNKYTEARKVFSDQYTLARGTSLEAEVELCRAIGNQGMSAYNLAILKDPCDQELLQVAFAQNRERIDRARAVHRRLLNEDPSSKHIATVESWETIGMDRLTLCHIANGDTEGAVRQAEESQRTRITQDPTVIAFSRFFYGNALWRNNQHEEALRQWKMPSDTCAPAIAICKLPSAEHAGYLSQLAEAGVEFDSYDEQGFSALDYAVLSDTEDAKQMTQILVDAYRVSLRKKFDRYYPPLDEEEKRIKIEEAVNLRMQQSNLRKNYQAVLQELVRPLLKTHRHDSIRELRKVYKQSLLQDASKRGMFDYFDYVKYNRFREHGRLPQSIEKVSKRFEESTDGTLEDDKDDYVIFLSYRWIGRISDPPLEGPDDARDTQWHRMMKAVDEFLEKKGARIDRDRLGIWLDCACIDQRQQDRKERGIAALPLAVTQCNAMISLVDEEYYERAWCAVEVMLMRELIDSYRLHEWWEHVLHAPQINRLNGSLRMGRLKRVIDAEGLKLTKEKEDRSRINFLIRQSKLLGIGDALPLALGTRLNNCNL